MTKLYAHFLGGGCSTVFTVVCVHILFSTVYYVRIKNVKKKPKHTLYHSQVLFHAPAGLNNKQLRLVLQGGAILAAEKPKKMKTICFTSSLKFFYKCKL